MNLKTLSPILIGAALTSSSASARPTVIPGGSTVSPGVIVTAGPAADAPLGSLVVTKPQPAPVVVSAPAVTGTLFLRSNRNADVYLDEQYLGQAPLDVAQVAPGFHVLKLVNRATGEIRTKPLRIPHEYPTARTVQVHFPTPAVVVAPTPRVVLSPVFRIGRGPSRRSRRHRR